MNKRASAPKWKLEGMRAQVAEAEAPGQCPDGLFLLPVSPGLPSVPGCPERTHTGSCAQWHLVTKGMPVGSRGTRPGTAAEQLHLDIRDFATSLTPVRGVFQRYGNSCLAGLVLNPREAGCNTGTKFAVLSWRGAKCTFYSRYRLWQHFLGFFFISPK